MKSDKIGKCEYCGYEGLTDYYRGMNHCMRCNRIVKVKR